MTDPRLTDVRSAMIHLEGVESAIRRISGPFDEPALDAAAELAAQLRDVLERAARLLDPLARDPLARRAGEHPVNTHDDEVREGWR